MRYPHQNSYIGTGEFTDSLALDHITQYSIPLIDFFGKYPEVTFELKTKSNNLANVLKARHKGNVVISWSLNPEKVIKENEFYTASLENRFNSALKAVNAGYRVGFHLDPIIYYQGWESGYKGLINRLFDLIPANKIAWISLGALRFNPRLKTIIENRFPDIGLMEGELLVDFDRKLRYSSGLRYVMYENILKWLRKRARKALIYLCMEEKAIWDNLAMYFRA